MSLVVQSWRYAQLEDLLIHVIGGDWGKDEDFIDDGFEAVSCIRGAEFKNWKNELGSTAVTRKIKFSSLETRKLTEGDLLIEISGGGPEQPVGRTVLITKQVLKQLSYPAVCTNFLRLARPSEYFNSAYLNHYLTKFYNSGEIVNYQSGSNNLRNLKFKEYSKIKIPVPPLTEQKIIADRLDILLEKIESAKSRLERILCILKTFRQSVLVAAVSGKLTEEWRGHECGSKNGYPNNWTELGFSDVGELARGKSKHRPRNDPRLFGNEYPFIQTGEVANSNGYIINATKYYSEFGLSQSKLFPKGTLCITIAANIADTSILGIDACFPDSVVGFTPDPEKCEVLFVKYLIDVNKSNLEDFAPATAQKNINLKILNAMKFPFPSLEEQAEIVLRVEQLFAFADRIEHKIDASLKRVNSMTQSILAKAFRGELTTDWRAANPELICGENSAESLLKKIKAERETIKRQPKPKCIDVKKNTGSRMSKQIIKVVEALKKAGEPLSGQQLLAAAGYPSDSSTDQLEQFFLELRDALTIEKSIVKLERDDDSQDWFALATPSINKVKD